MVLSFFRKTFLLSFVLLCGITQPMEKEVLATKNVAEMTYDAVQDTWNITIPNTNQVLSFSSEELRAIYESMPSDITWRALQENNDLLERYIGQHKIVPSKKTDKPTNSHKHKKSSLDYDFQQKMKRLKSQHSTGNRDKYMVEMERIGYKDVKELLRRGDKDGLENIIQELKKSFSGLFAKIFAGSGRKLREQFISKAEEVLNSPLMYKLNAVKEGDLDRALKYYYQLPDRYDPSIGFNPQAAGAALLNARNDYRKRMIDEKLTQREEQAKQALAEHKKEKKVESAVKEQTAETEASPILTENTSLPISSPEDMDMISTPACNRTPNISPEVDQLIVEALGHVRIQDYDIFDAYMEASMQVLLEMKEKGLLEPEKQINALGIMVGTYLQDMADTEKWKDSFVEFVEQQGKPMREAANVAYKDICKRYPELNLPEDLDYANVDELDQIITSTIDEDSNLSPEEKVHVDRARHAAQLTRTGVIYGAFLYAAGQMGALESSGPAYTPNNLDNIINSAPAMVTTEGVVVQPVAAEAEMGYIAAAVSYLQNFFGPDNNQNQNADQESSPKNRNQKINDFRSLTNKEARQKAKELGYIEVGGHPCGNTRGKPVFQNGKRYITPDVDGHRGGVWKMFDKSGRRIGTFNINLTESIGK